MSTSESDKEITFEVLKKIKEDLEENFGDFVIKEFFLFSKESIPEGLELVSNLPNDRVYTVHFRYEDSLPLTNPEAVPYFKTILDHLVSRKNILRSSGTDWFEATPNPRVHEVAMH